MNHLDNNLIQLPIAFNQSSGSPNPAPNPAPAANSPNAAEQSSPTRQ
jgi:hypothetical protein